MCKQDKCNFACFLKRYGRFSAIYVLICSLLQGKQIDSFPKDYLFGIISVVNKSASDPQQESEESNAWQPRVREVFVYINNKMVHKMGAGVRLSQ